jgi:ubiquinone/menaquinone biosynthesis C-methylase UbiE
MPTVDANKKVWDREYKWTNRGDEWSVAWEGPFMQWYGTILPRIHRFIPTDSILEIACGYGRWTQFLKDMCHNLVVIELSKKCIQVCRQRFSECSNIEYHLNDGKSLEMISDASIDFVFSFDSLVHADESVLKSYISQLPRILKDEGVVFIHHSNLGECYPSHSIIRRISKLEGLLRRLRILEKSTHWRDSGVSAKVVEDLAEEHGLKCISQEVINWGTKRALIDCFSTIVKNTSSLALNNRVLRNANFMHEVRNLSQLSSLYTIS